jgi:hypothetical protein
MSTDDHWITTRNNEARKCHSLVTEAVSARIEQLLKGQLSDGQLTSTELTSVARELIADMVPTPPRAEAKQ